MTSRCDANSQVVIKILSVLSTDFAVPDRVTSMRVLAYLVLDEELDTLDGGSSSLGDSGGNTTHYYILVSIPRNIQQSIQLVDIMKNQSIGRIAFDYETHSKSRQRIPIR